MQKAFEESRNRMREKIRKEQELEKKKARKTQIGLCGLVIVCVVLVILAGNMQNKAIKNCMKKGNSYNYCIEHS